MTFDTLSIIYLAVLAIFVLIGLFTGFIKSIFGFLKVIISTVIASIASKPIADFMKDRSFILKWKDSLETALNNKAEIFQTTYSSEYFDEAFSKLNLPEIIKDLLLKIVNYLIPEMSETFGSIIARSIIYYSLIVVSFIVVYILVRILFSLIIHIFSKHEKNNPPLKAINRILGMAMYFIIGLLIIGGVNYIFTFIISNGSNVSTWLVNTMHLEDDVFTISKFLYKHNTLLWLIQLIQSNMFK